MRRGRVVGRKGFVLDKVEELTPGGLVDRILEDLYGDEPPAGVPKQVLVPVEPDDTPTYEEWLTHLRGSRVQIRVPQRGDKRELHATVTRNASEEFLRPSMLVFLDAACARPQGMSAGVSYALNLVATGEGCAVHSKLSATQGYTTLDLKVAYHRAMTDRTGPIRAEGKVVSFGRRAAFAEARIVDAAGRIYATATSTLLVFER